MITSRGLIFSIVIAIFCDLGYAQLAPHNAASTSGFVPQEQPKLPKDAPFELYRFCGYGSVPLSSKQAQANLKKLSPQDFQSVRDVTGVSNDAWYQITGAYDKVREAFGINIKIATTAQEIQQKRIDYEIENALHQLATNRGLDPHGSLEKQMSNYLEGDLSLPELLKGASCALTDSLLSCVSRNPESHMKINAKEMIDLKNTVRARMQPALILKPVPFLGRHDSEASVAPAAILDFQANRIDAKLIQEMKEDFLLMNLVPMISGRDCVIGDGKLSCLLTEEEVAVAGQKWITIGAASFDAYGITIGHAAAEQQKALQDFLRRARQASSNDNDPEWVMQGNLVEATCMGSGCHDNGKSLEYDRQWTALDRFKSIWNGASSGAGTVAATGAVTGLIYSGGDLTAATLGGIIGGGVGVVGGGVAGALKPETFGNPTGAIILPRDHPRNPGEKGLSYTGTPIKNPDAPIDNTPIDTNSQPNGPDVVKDEAEDGPFEDVSNNFCPTTDSPTSCKKLPFEGDALAKMAMNALCQPITRDMFDRTYADPTLDLTQDQAETDRLKRTLDDITVTVNPECLLEGKTKEQCSKPEIVKPVKHENIHIDPDLFDLGDTGVSPDSVKNPSPVIPMRWNN